MQVKAKKRLVIGLSVLGLILGMAVLFFARAQFKGDVNAVEVDLAHPDILIRSTQLAELPKDVVHAPLLDGILTDEVVHYYEDHPTKLSLLGTLKRLAFDSQLSWSEKLLAQALQAPAELALWRDGKGRPSYFVLLLEQNPLTQILTQLSQVTLPDEQLSVVGKLATATGQATVYALKFQARQTWLLVSAGERLVVLSEPGLLLNVDRQLHSGSQKIIESLLKNPAPAPTLFAKSFGLGTLSGVKQQINARTDYLAFGYQYFFPGWQALQVQMTPQGQWSLHAKLTRSASDTWQQSAAALWTSLPRSSALCVALPVDWAKALPIVQQVSKQAAQTVLTQLGPISASCWQATGGLYAPLFATQLKQAADADYDQALQTLLAEVLRQQAAKGSGAADKAPIAPTREEALAAPAQGKWWQRTIPHEFGNQQQGQVHAHVVALARANKTLLASIDSKAVLPALAVARKSAPAQADERNVTGTPIVTLDGAELATLLEAQTWQTLSPQAVPTFYRVARQLLVPRLQALRKLGRVRLVLPAQPTWVEAVPGDDSPDARWVGLEVQRVR